jgi:hypothetical protein
LRIAAAQEEPGAAPFGTLIIVIVAHMVAHAMATPVIRAAPPVATAFMPVPTTAIIIVITIAR